VFKHTHTQLKTLRHLVQRKKKFNTKRTRIPERFHLKNISVVCSTLFDVQSLFHQMARADANVLFCFFLKTKERKEERVSSRESTQLTRVIRHVIERDAKIYIFDMKEESCYTLRVVKKNMTKNLPERMQKISPPTKKGNTSREMEESYSILWPTSFEWSTVQTKTRISIQVCFFFKSHLKTYVFVSKCFSIPEMKK
jgi:hypothetical protein